MHLPVRLRVPLAGLALCSTALLISACGGSSASDSPTARAARRSGDAVAVVGVETVAKSSSTTRMTSVCVQYKAAKKACPKPGSAARKQLQQSFVAQLVQQAEFDEAGKQLKVTVEAGGCDARTWTSSSCSTRRAPTARSTPPSGRRSSRTTTRRRPLVVENLRDGLCAQAIYVEADQERRRVNDRTWPAYYTKNKKAATRRPRAGDPPHPGQEQGARRQDLRAARRRATRSSPRSPRSTRSIRARRRTAASSAASRRVRPSRLRQGRVQHPDRQGRAAGQELLRLARDRGHGRYRPGLAEAAQRGAQEDDPRHPPDPEEADRRQQVVHGLPEEDREERPLRGRPRAAEDDEHGGHDGRHATTAG